jgi:predicted DNA-binding protein (UPF0251 family)
MVRPKKWRRVSAVLPQYEFRPRGILASQLEIAELKGDELEAMRLCYVQDLMHVKAAQKMKVSRRTLERVLNSGRRKVTEALLQGKGIEITMPSYLSYANKKGGE